MAVFLSSMSKLFPKKSLPGWYNRVMIKVKQSWECDCGRKSDAIRMISSIESSGVVSESIPRDCECGRRSGRGRLVGSSSEDYSGGFLVVFEEVPDSGSVGAI